jgi:L-histidine Nalpha-methyltransferase
VVDSLRTIVCGNAHGMLARDIRHYLSQKPRQLPSHYLYDAMGSRLFEAICCLPWYGVTRAETRLLAAHRHDILTAADRLTRIVELGCGNGDKLATLVAGSRPSPEVLDLHMIDLSATALAQSARRLREMDGVQVFTHEAQYEAGLMDMRARKAHDRTLALFLGSNIGNFDPPGDEEFLRTIRAALRPGDVFLLGADLLKPEPVLQLAYDDPLGVTAAFNRNLLVRMNREMGGDFDLSAFAHRAVWNAARSRVEMHLVSLRSQEVRLEAAGIEFTLEAGEPILTESSYKYEPAAVKALVERAGFVGRAQWIDTEGGFALTLADAAPS